MKRPPLPADDDGPMDYLFCRVSAEQLAKAIIGDVRATPSPLQLAQAQGILDNTGTLYRILAGFNLDEWQVETRSTGVTENEHTNARHLKGCCERREVPTWAAIEAAADALLSRHTGTFSQDKGQR